MADKRIRDLTNETTAPDDDTDVGVVDSTTGGTSRITRGNLLGGSPTAEMNIGDLTVTDSVDFSAAQLATTDYGDGTVTAGKRSGGFAVGVIDSSTLSTTGNKSVTGVGFEPKLVMFYDAYAGGSAYGGMGAATDSSNQWAKAWGVRVSVDGGDSFFATDRCSISMTVDAGGTATLAQEISFVSQDSDGFTVNVVTAQNEAVAWVAYG